MQLLRVMPLELPKTRELCPLEQPGDRSPTPESHAFDQSIPKSCDPWISQFPRVVTLGAANSLEL